MNLIDLLALFSPNDFALVLRCVFDRIPVIIGGKDKEFLDDFIIKLCDSMPIRKEVIFGTDFLEREEHEVIIQEERMNYDNHRLIFRAPVNSEDMVLKNIADLKGWIIGMCMNGDADAFFEKAARLRKKSPISLFIKFNEKNQLDFVKLYAADDSKLDTSLEKLIVKKTFSQTEHALERIKRVLDRKTQGSSSINSSIVASLIDLTQEESIIKENVFKKEVLEFYQASRRGLALLTRLNFLNQFQPVKIGKKTFFDAISYDDASTPRFLDFVQAEWGECFDGLIDDSRLSVLGDHLDSLWG